MTMTNPLGLHAKNGEIADDTFLRAILRTSFAPFLHKVFKTLNPGSKFEDNWHLEAIAYELSKIVDGDTQRLIITQPPRSLKSITTSIAWVAWLLGQDPTRTFLCISYSQDLAADLSNKFRLIVESDWYKALFPNTRFTKLNENEAKTSQGGGRITTSIGGTLTGRGADIVIIDDPLKAEDSASTTKRQRVIDWYRTTLISRLNNQKQGAIVVVMQRLHEDDLVGYLTSTERQLGNDPVAGTDPGQTPERETLPWSRLNLPAIAEEDQEIQIGPDKFHARKEGDVLHPAREDSPQLMRIKNDIGSQRFSAQYQQSPIPKDGDLIKRAWLFPYSQEEIRRLMSADYARIVQSWDIAASTTDTADWSACTTWLRCRDKHYLLDTIRVRKSYPDLKKLVLSHQVKWDARTVLIEENGLGLVLVQDLRSGHTPGFSPPIGIRVHKDKLVRMEAQSAKIEAGQVFIPQEAHWLDIYLNELMAFPQSKYDDQVDSTSLYLNWANQKRRSSGMFSAELISVARR